MKSLLTLMVLVAALVAVPAMAEDGNVSDSTLSSLGLGGMELLSDADGMSVRGMASYGASAGAVVSGLGLFHTSTGSFIRSQSNSGYGAFSTNTRAVPSFGGGQAGGGAAMLAPPGPWLVLVDSNPDYFTLWEITITFEVAGGSVFGSFGVR